MSNKTQPLNEDDTVPYALTLAMLMTPAKREEALEMLSLIRQKHGEAFSKHVYKVAQGFRKSSSQLATQEDTEQVDEIDNGPKGRVQTDKINYDTTRNSTGGHAGKDELAARRASAAQDKELAKIGTKPLRMPAKPKVELDTIWRKVEDVVGSCVPDGDPIDYIGPWCERNRIPYEMVTKAARKNGYKDMYEYYDEIIEMYNEYQRELGNESVEEMAFKPEHIEAETPDYWLGKIDAEKARRSKFKKEDAPVQGDIEKVQGTEVTIKNQDGTKTVAPTSMLSKDVKGALTLNKAAVGGQPGAAPQQNPITPGAKVNVVSAEGTDAERLRKLAGL